MDVATHTNGGLALFGEKKGVITRSNTKLQESAFPCKIQLMTDDPSSFVFKQLQQVSVSPFSLPFCVLIKPHLARVCVCVHGSRHGRQVCLSVCLYPSLFDHDPSSHFGVDELQHSINDSHLQTTLSSSLTTQPAARRPKKYHQNARLELCH